MCEECDAALEAAKKESREAATLERDQDDEIIEDVVQTPDTSSIKTGVELFSDSTITTE